MNEFFFSKDAFQNYFSELIGIIITVILIPIFISINNKKINSNRRHLARQILFKLTIDYLDKITPKDLRIKKVYSYRKWIETFTTPFELKPNFRNVGEFLLMDRLKKLDTNDLRKEVKKLYKSFKSINKDFSAFFSSNGDIMGREINRRYLQLQFNIKMQELPDTKDDFDLYCYVETWLIVIDLIYEIRNLLTKGHKKEELTKDSFKFLNEPETNASP